MRKKTVVGQLGDQEIKQLRIFKAVSDSGGFSAAEAELNISRPTISNQIAALETRLGLTLCKRGRSGFQLTDEGRIAYEEACELLKQVEKFRATVQNLNGNVTGTLRISLSDSLGSDPRCDLPGVIADFKAQVPLVEIELYVESMSAMEKRVLNGEVDLAIIPEHRRLYGLDYLPLFTDTHYLYCAPNHPLFNAASEEVTPEQLNEYDLVHAGLNPHEEAYNHVYEMKRTAISYFYETRLIFLRSGKYIGFLPEAFARPYVDEGTLKSLCPAQRKFEISMSLITKKTREPSKQLQFFLKIFKDRNSRDLGLGA